MRVVPSRCVSPYVCRSATPQRICQMVQISVAPEPSDACCTTLRNRRGSDLVRTTPRSLRATQGAQVADMWGAQPPSEVQWRPFAAQFALRIHNPSKRQAYARMRVECVAYPHVLPSPLNDIWGRQFGRRCRGSTCVSTESSHRMWSEANQSSSHTSVASTATELQNLALSFPSDAPQLGFVGRWGVQPPTRKGRRRSPH